MCPSCPCICPIHILMDCPAFASSNCAAAASLNARLAESTMLLICLVPLFQSTSTDTHQWNKCCTSEHSKSSFWCSNWVVLGRRCFNTSAVPGTRYHVVRQLHQGCMLQYNRCKDTTLIIMSGVSIQLVPSCTLPADGWSPSATVTGTMGLHHADFTFSTGIKTAYAKEKRLRHTNTSHGCQIGTKTHKTNRRWQCSFKGGAIRPFKVDRLWDDTHRCCVLQGIAHVPCVRAEWHEYNAMIM